MPRFASIDFRTILVLGSVLLGSPPAHSATPERVAYLNNGYAPVRSLREIAGQYFAAGDNGTLCSSSDLVSWQRNSIGTTGNLTDIQRINQTIVVVGDSGRILVSNADSLSFHAVSSGTTNGLKKLVVGTASLIAVGDSGTILSSSDGKNWNMQITDPPANLTAGVFAAGKYLVVGDTAAFLSTDGRDWQHTNDPTGGTCTSNFFNSVTYFGSRYLGVGRANLTISLDSGQSSWSAGSCKPYCGYYDVAIVDERLVAVGYVIQFYRNGKFGGLVEMPSIDTMGMLTLSGSSYYVGTSPWSNFYTILPVPDGFLTAGDGGNIYFFRTSPARVTNRSQSPRAVALRNPRSTRQVFMGRVVLRTASGVFSITGQKRTSNTLSH